MWLLADWLAAKAPDWVTGRLQGAQMILHGHCHHKAVFGGPTNEIALLRKAGAEVEMINSTCCGMAGPFGFEADKIEVSKAIANLGLMPAVKAAAHTTVIVADGFSCREQINQLSDREGMHFAEVLDHACGCSVSWISRKGESPYTSTTPAAHAAHLLIRGPLHRDGRSVCN